MLTKDIGAVASENFKGIMGGCESTSEMFINEQDVVVATWLVLGSSGVVLVGGGIWKGSEIIW